MELRGVSAGYNKNVVLHDVSFEANEPAIYVVLGPNGAGKTTLFRTVAGVLTPYTGQILLDDHNLQSPSSRQRINYLSHYYAIPDEMTVERALYFWAEMQAAERNAVEEMISTFDLGSLRQKKFSDLSQGQKKRVSISAVFLKEGDLYLLDEPTSNLDPGFSKEIREILLRISKEKIVLYSSHNLYEASDIGTSLILIRNGSVSFFDKIENIRPKHYRFGIKASEDITKLVDAKKEGVYYILEVPDTEAAARVIKKLVENGIAIYEMRQLDNPLQELFGEKGQ